MKRKLLLAFALGVVATFATAFGVGCSNTPEHNFGEWVLDREASCTEVGRKYRACQDEGCIEMEWEVIPKTAHKYDIINRTHAGHSFTCSVCKTTTETEPHNFKNGICTACGADENEDYNFAFELSSDKNYYTLKSATNKNATEIIIPSAYKGKPVTVIGENAFNNFTELKNVSIPDSITVISAGAFYGCTALEEISIPDSVKNTISGWGNTVTTNSNVLSDDNIKGAFENCTSLKRITLSKNLLNLHSKFFRNCTSLESITLPDNCTVSGDVFDGCTNLTEIKVGENNQLYQTIDGNLYGNDGIELIRYIGKQEEFEIPQTVGAIDPYAFSNCSWLKDVIFNSDTEWELLIISDYNIEDKITLSIEQLNDSATMAEYLTISQCFRYWFRVGKVKF